MGQRSSIDDLPPAVLDAVHAAIGRGAPIDDIVATIAAMGEERSRSAVGRYTKKFADLAKNQRELRTVAEAFGTEFGEAGNLEGRMMVQLMTSVLTRAVLPIAMGEDVDLSTKELMELGRAAKDITSAAKIDVDREAKIRDEAAKRAKTQAAEVAETVGRAAGATPETLARIRAGILGLTA